MDGADENFTVETPPSAGGNQSTLIPISEETEQEEYEKLNRRFDDTVVIFGKKTPSHYARQQWNMMMKSKAMPLTMLFIDRNMWLYELRIPVSILPPPPPNTSLPKTL